MFEKLKKFKKVMHSFLIKYSYPQLLGKKKKKKLKVKKKISVQKMKEI